jgi:uncharacterized protein with GYD domain
MSQNIALVSYTDKGIALVKDSPNRLDRAQAAMRTAGLLRQVVGVKDRGPVGAGEHDLAGSG